MLGARIKKRPVVFAGWLLSLLVLVVAIGSFFWPFTYGSGDGNEYVVDFEDSSASFYSIEGLDSDPIGPGWVRWEGRGIENLSVALSKFFSLGGFSNAPLILCIPIGWPSALALLVTAILFWRRRGYPAGCCAACGYDLTGNMTGRCSECGVSVYPNHR